MDYRNVFALLNLQANKYFLKEKNNAKYYYRMM